jgi:hypothetical protein
LPKYLRAQHLVPDKLKLYETMGFRDVIVIAIVTLLGTAACAGATAGESDFLRVKRGIWAYSGLTGPEAWGTIKPEFALCGNGTFQSPFAISSKTCNFASRGKAVRNPVVKLQKSKLRYEEEVRRLRLSMRHLVAPMLFSCAPADTNHSHYLSI